MESTVFKIAAGVLIALAVLALLPWLGIVAFVRPAWVGVLAVLLFAYWFGSRLR